MAGTTPFEFTKNYKFTVLNNENVWAKAVNRVLNEKVPVGQGDRRDDRAHQGGRRLIADAISDAGRRWSCGRRHCATVRRSRSTDTQPAAGRPGREAGMVAVADRGALILLAPYLLVFLVFVLYPVGYGLWLARHPESYVKLFDDPIFFRTVVNTLVFLVVAINVKMMIALVLSGFFVQTRWWIKVLSVLFILPWAVPSIPTILSVRFMLNPEWGVINSLIFRLHRPRRPELAQRPDAGAVASRC